MRLYQIYTPPPPLSVTVLCYCVVILCCALCCIVWCGEESCCVVLCRVVTCRVMSCRVMLSCYAENSFLQSTISINLKKLNGTNYF